MDFINIIVICLLGFFVLIIIGAWLLLVSE